MSGFKGRPLAPELRQELYDAAMEHIDLVARAAAALERRDRLIYQALYAGASQTEIARLTGISTQRVSQLARHEVAR